MCFNCFSILGFSQNGAADRDLTFDPKSSWR
jgi:hypothetical protein